MSAPKLNLPLDISSHDLREFIRGALDAAEGDHDLILDTWRRYAQQRDAQWSAEVERQAAEITRLAGLESARGQQVVELQEMATMLRAQMHAERDAKNAEIARLNAEVQRLTEIYTAATAEIDRLRGWIDSTGAALESEIVDIERRGRYADAFDALAPLIRDHFWSNPK